MDRALERMTHVRIADVPELDGRDLLLVADPSQVRELSRLLAIVPPAERFHCMCPGDQVLEFSIGRRGHVAITLHHGRSIRWERWDSDALLADGPRLLRWLAQHGAPGPLDAWEGDVARAERDLLAWDTWQGAAPPALAGYLRLPELATGVNPEYPSERLLDAEEALRASYADGDETIIALLEWFGTGAGPWSGFPSYESVAEALLLRHTTDAIVHAISARPPTPKGVEGAARLFASWWFGRMRPGETSALPEGLRRDLLAHVRSSGDPDKLARLTHALGEGGTVSETWKQIKELSAAKKLLLVGLLVAAVAVGIALAALGLSPEG